MVTKIELEEECKENIARLTKELKALEAQHGRFSAEDKTDKEREEKYVNLIHQIAKLQDKTYIGNFGNRDNWYNSRIPTTLRFSKKQISEDSGFINDALNELKKDRQEEIEHSEEYLALKKQMDECSFSKFSTEHRKLHDDISKVKNDIL
jgi:septal ring factor EnvC (AmiA/AmiB activator)